MQGKIILEEHFATDDTIEDSKGFLPVAVWQELRSRLLDIQDKRLREMDKHGVERMLVSLNAPAIQAIPDVKRANDVARRANDILAAEVAKRPDRFSAFAAVPLQDPDLASREVERCVKDLGFIGALANGFSQVKDANTAYYYDLPQYRPFWATVEKLDVPFYLHPRNPLPSMAQIYDGHPWLLGPTWAFGAETSVHALRLMGSGLFDEHPRLQIILGHMGEHLPFSMWRIDNRNHWSNSPHNCPAKKKMGEYFRENFYITTAGNFRTPSLVSAMQEIGVERIMFSADWPFEDIGEGATWFDAAEIAEADRVRIGRDNALRLFKLGHAKR